MMMMMMMMMSGEGGDCHGDRHDLALDVARTQRARCTTTGAPHQTNIDRHRQI